MNNTSKYVADDGVVFDLKSAMECYIGYITVRKEV